MIKFLNAIKIKRNNDKKINRMRKNGTFENINVLLFDLSAIYENNLISKKFYNNEREFLLFIRDFRKWKPNV